VSVRVAVFASGGGSNLQALLDRFETSRDATIALVVSNRGDAGALGRAHAAGVPAVHVDTNRHVDDVAAATLQLLEEHDIELIALAGYLKLVPPQVTTRYRDRIINIHPALLPAFGGRGMFGKNVHEAVLRARCTVTGATVHHVDERYDEGAIIAQWPVPVLPGDDAQTLAARVLRIEHRLYPAAVAAIANRLRGNLQGAAAANDVFRLTGLIDGIDAEMRALAPHE
jgi:phosphoribosylglycinamide formyltransferase 1